MRMLVTIAMLAACTCYGAGWNDAAWSKEYPTAAVYQNIYSATVERAVAAGVLTVNTGFPLRAPAVVLHSIVPSNTVCVTNFIGTNEYVVCWTNYTLNLVEWTNTDWQTTFYGTFFTIDYPSKAYLKAIYDVMAATALQFDDLGTNSAVGGSLDEWLKSGTRWLWSTNECPGCNGADGWSLVPTKRSGTELFSLSMAALMSNTQSGADLVRYTVDTNTQAAVLYGYQDDPPDYCTYSFTNTYYGTTNWTHNWQLTIAATSPASWWLGGQRCMLNRTFAETNVVGTGSNAVTNVVQYQVCGWSNFYGSTVPHGQMQYADWPAVKVLSTCRTNIDQESVSVNVVGPHSRRDAVLCGDGGVTSGVGAIVWNTTQTLSKLFYALSVVSTQGVVGSPSYTNVLGSNSMLGAAIDYYADSTNMALYGAATGGVLCATTLSEMRDCLNAMRVIASASGLDIGSKKESSSAWLDYAYPYYTLSCDPETPIEMDGDTCADVVASIGALFDCLDSVTPTVEQLSSTPGIPRARYDASGEGGFTAIKEFVGPMVFTQMYAAAGGFVDVYFGVQPREESDLAGSGLVASENITGCGQSYYAWRLQHSQALTQTTVVTIAESIAMPSRSSVGCDGEDYFIRDRGFYADMGSRLVAPIIVKRVSFVYTEE